MGLHGGDDDWFVSGGDRLKNVSVLVRSAIAQFYVDYGIFHGLPEWVFHRMQKRRNSVYY